MTKVVRERLLMDPPQLSKCLSTVLLPRDSHVDVVRFC
jgi:hypothetical protein